MAFDKIKVSKQRMDFFERTSLAAATVLLSDNVEHDFATHEAAFAATLRVNDPLDVCNFAQHVWQIRKDVNPNKALETLALQAFYSGILRCDDHHAFGLAVWLFDIAEDQDREIAQKAFDAVVTKMNAATEQRDPIALDIAAWLSEQTDFCTDKSREAVAKTVERLFSSHVNFTHKEANKDNDFDCEEDSISFYEVLLEEAEDLLQQHADNPKVRKYALDAIGRSLVKLATEGVFESSLHSVMQFLEIAQENSRHEAKALEALELYFLSENDDVSEDFEAFCNIVQTDDHPKKDKLIETTNKIRSTLQSRAQVAASRKFDF